MSSVNDNNRVFFACQAVVVSGGSGFPGSAGRYLQGVQSVSMSSSADTEQVFQFGTVGLFENYNTRSTGDGELTIEKFIGEKKNHSVGAMLCGDPTISGNYAFINGGTQTVPSQENKWTYGFNNMSSKKMTVMVYLLPEASGIKKNGDTAEGTKIEFEDAIVSEYSVAAQIDGPATESVTFVSNTFGTAYSDETFETDSNFNYTGNVVKRGGLSGDFSDGDSVSYSISIGNEDLFSLGQLDPYAKVPTFPASVTVEATRKAKSGFNSAAGGAGGVKETSFGGLEVGSSGLVLTNTSYGGGDAGGGNATITETYSSFNAFNVKWT